MVRSHSKSHKRAAVTASSTQPPGEPKATMLVIGLTGGIGMGKSFVTNELRNLDVPVYDADATVHKLYAPAGGAVEPVRALFGDEVVSPDGSVNRAELSKKVLGSEEHHQDAMKQLEQVVHPLVEAEKHDFLQQAYKNNNKLVVLDIPLLFEKHNESSVDFVVVVSAGEEKQRERCLARPGMTAENFESIVNRQVADSVKTTNADRVIDTGCAPEETKQAVTALVEEIRSKIGSETFKPKVFEARE